MLAFPPIVVGTAKATGQGVTVAGGQTGRVSLGSGDPPVVLLPQHRQEGIWPRR